MIKVHVEHGGFAMVPRIDRDRELEQDHAFGGVAGSDEGLAAQRSGGERLERGEGGVDVGQVLHLGGAGSELLIVGGKQRGGEVLEEERKAQRVFDAQVGEDVEVIFRFVAADDERVGLEDRMRGIDGGVRDGEIYGLRRASANDQRQDNTKQQKGD